MKKGDGISFWPQPILHVDMPLEVMDTMSLSSRHMVIVINGIIVVMLH
jgi:hypothetical protein